MAREIWTIMVSAPQTEWDANPDLWQGAAYWGGFATAYSGP